ncbi:FG-GAP-like repeat-containing protein [Calditrichota bacterium]
MFFLKRAASFIVFVQFVLVSICLSQDEFVQHSITDELTGAKTARAVDIDGDGDLDILCANVDGNSGSITWLENDGDQEFTDHTIDSNIDCWSARAVDLDDDDDMDVIGASVQRDDIRWYDNDGDEDFDQSQIYNYFADCADLYPADVDDDGDIDVIGGSIFAIVFFRNNGNETFTQNVVDMNVSSVNQFHAIDLDEDDDIDIVTAIYGSDRISWYENNGNAAFTGHAITTSFDGAYSVHVADLDSDGDLDIVGAAELDDEITWWENDGDEDFTEYVLSDEYNEARSVYTVDLEGDGDIDIISAGGDDEDGKITWWINDGEAEFTQIDCEDIIASAWSVHAADIDGDGDMDIISAADGDGEVSWWENLIDFEPGEVPLPFSLSSPDSGTIFQDNEIVLEWAETTDPDEGDRIVYEVYISTDPDSIQDGFFADTSGTSLPFIGEFGNEYWWTVKAQDTNSDGTWATEIWSFTIPAQAPLEFSLLSPDSGYESPIADVELTWESSFDPDLGDTINYEIYVSTEAESLFVNLVETGTDTFYTLTCEYGLNYWWTIRAVDSNTEGTWANQNWSFSIPVQPPSEFSLTGPDSGFVTDDGELTLSWQTSTDQDLMEEIEYEVYVSTDLMNLSDQLVESVSDTVLTITGVINEIYWWTVKAVDSNTDGTWANETWSYSFSLEENGVNESLGLNVPEKWEISSIYPNPFNPVATIVVSLPESADLTVRVLNVLGQEISTIARGRYTQGFHKMNFEGMNNPSGIYFIQAIVPGHLNTIRRIVLTK